MVPTMLTLLAASLAATAVATSPQPHVRRDEATPGRVHTYPLPGCGDESIMGKGSDWDMPPDHCLKVSTATSFRIREPAICANGTRAKLARYEGRDCNWGEVTLNGGLVDISDDDLGVCQEIGIEGHVSNATHASVASFGWFCEGRKGDRPEGWDDVGGPKMELGSFSRTTCGGPDGFRAPTWDHPPPDTCNAILSTEKLDIYKAAVCEDGKRSRLAVWYGTRTCEGKHDALTEIDDDMLKKCLVINAVNHSSFAFWCEGVDSAGATFRGVGGGVLLLTGLVLSGALGGLI